MNMIKISVCGSWSHQVYVYCRRDPTTIQGNPVRLYIHLVSICHFLILNGALREES